MAGQVSISIGDRQWTAEVALTPWEQHLGLGGIAGIPAGAGMLFDLGYPQVIGVTTEPMLFPLDIAFFSQDWAVTEIYHDVAPGLLLSSASPARYFLEVNAGELEAVKPGDPVAVAPLPLQATPVGPSWVGWVAAFGGLALVGTLLSGLLREPVPAFAGQGDNTPPSPTVDGREGEPLPPQYRDIRRFIAEPLPPGQSALALSVIVAGEKERKIDAVLRQLKEGVEGIQQGENFRSFLVTMSRFHEYSLGNQMLIMLQKPGATRVAGFNTWKDLGRWVKKRESGIAILAPIMPPKRRVEASKKEGPTEGEEEEQQVVEPRPVNFKVVYVFDVSQTEGKPLPDVEVPALSGVADERLFAGALELARSQGLAVSFDPMPHQDPEVKGFYSGKTIWVRPEESRAQQLKTLLHELGHYYTQGVFHIPRRDAETIAESVAFTVGAHFGFDSGTRSFPYVALWSKDKKVLEQNLAAIRRVAGNMIESLEAVQKKAALA